MGAILGGPKMPPPLPPIPPPSRSDADVNAEAAAERRRRRLAQGRASTILTGDEGVTQAGVVSRPTLLGGQSQGTGS